MGNSVDKVTTLSLKGIVLAPTASASAGTNVMYRK